MVSENMENEKKELPFPSESLPGLPEYSKEPPNGEVFDVEECSEFEGREERKNMSTRYTVTAIFLVLLFATTIFLAIQNFRYMDKLQELKRRTQECEKFNDMFTEQDSKENDNNNQLQLAISRPNNNKIFETARSCLGTAGGDSWCLWKCMVKALKPLIFPQYRDYPHGGPPPSGKRW